jgi:hypothetical protein
MIKKYSNKNILISNPKKQYNLNKQYKTAYKIGKFDKIIKTINKKI